MPTALNALIQVVRGNTLAMVSAIICNQSAVETDPSIASDFLFRHQFPESFLEHGEEVRVAGLQKCSELGRDVHQPDSASTSVLKDCVVNVRWMYIYKNNDGSALDQ